jgi:hypothetical protein
MTIFVDDDKLVDIHMECIENQWTRNQLKWHLSKAGYTLEHYDKVFAPEHQFVREGFERRAVIAAMILVIYFFLATLIGNKIENFLRGYLDGLGTYTRQIDGGGFTYSSGVEGRFVRSEPEYRQQEKVLDEDVWERVLASYYTNRLS